MSASGDAVAASASSAIGPSAIRDDAADPAAAAWRRAAFGRWVEIAETRPIHSAAQSVGISSTGATGLATIRSQTVIGSTPSELASMASVAPYRRNSNSSNRLSASP